MKQRIRLSESDLHKMIKESVRQVLREDDYTFLVYAKYGEDADADQLYLKRATYAVVTFLMAFVFLISNTTSGSILNSQFVLNLVLSAVIAVLIFKIPYMQLKSFYKSHLHEIDIMLPYYLNTKEYQTMSEIKDLVCPICGNSFSVKSIDF